MSLLLALEPAALRKVLKAGLRQGVRDQPLRQMITEAFGWADQPACCDQLLGLLQARGWLVRHGDNWKTRLG
jgi:hypothetical protein